jgi:hypothetical protein
LNNKFNAKIKADERNFSSIQTFQKALEFLSVMFCEVNVALSYFPAAFRFSMSRVSIQNSQQQRKSEIQSNPSINVDSVQFLSCKEIRIVFWQVDYQIDFFVLRSM